MSKARCYDNLHTFIYRLLKSHDPKANMTSECKDILNHLLRDLSIRYITASVALCRYAHKVTIDSNAVCTLTKLWVPNPKPLLDFAHDTWDVYSQNTVKGIKKARRAGLYLPPARFRELFREHRGVNQQIGEPAYIFLTAVLEVIFGMVIDQAIRTAQSENKITVTGVHVFRAINSKELLYLSPLFENSFIAGFGYAATPLLADAQQRWLERRTHEETPRDSRFTSSP